MLAIPVLASVFGAKDSTGIMLPMLLIGDFIAVYVYRGQAEWRKIRVLLPWSLAGIILGALVGRYISDSTFKILIGILVLFCLGILIYTERKGQDFKVPTKPWFYISTGILSGFSSMIGNAAGPIVSIYLLALGFKKNIYMGTNAWFFLIINALKFPLQLIIWQNINLNSLKLAGFMIPAILLGTVFGALIIKKINERFFRYLILIMTAISAIRLFM